MGSLIERKGIMRRPEPYEEMPPVLACSRFQIACAFFLAALRMMRVDGREQWLHQN